MACKTCCNNALGFVFGKQLSQHNTNAAFAWRRTPFLGICTVEHEQTNSIASGQCTKSSQICSAIINRCEIDLEVARVNNHALRSVQRNCMCKWHRVRYRYELNIKRSDATTLIVDNRNQFGFTQQPGFFNAVTSKTKRDRRAINRKRKFA